MLCSTISANAHNITITVRKRGVVSFSDEEILKPASAVMIENNNRPRSGQRHPTAKGSVAEDRIIEEDSSNVFMDAVLEKESYQLPEANKSQGL